MGGASVFLFALVLCLVVDAQGVASASPLFVSFSGSEGGDGSEERPFSLQEALTSTSDSPSQLLEVVLLPGIYNDSNARLFISSRRLRITSFAFYNQMEENDASIFDCHVNGSLSEAPVFTLFGEGSLDLQGLQFRHCRSVVEYRTSDLSQTALHPVTVEQCEFQNISENAFIVRGISSLDISDSSMKNSEGGLVYARGADDGSTMVRIANCSLTECSGLTLVRLTLTMEDSLFHTITNRAVFLNPSQELCSIRRCRFEQATSTSVDGASVYIEGIALHSDRTNVLLEECHFEGIHSKHGTVWLGNLQAEVKSCSFVGGVASQGGAIFASSASLSVSSTEFLENTADLGGAIFLQQKSSLKLSECDFANDTAMSGTYVYCLNSDDQIEGLSESLVVQLENNTQCKLRDDQESGKDSHSSSNWLGWLLLFAVPPVIAMIAATFVLRRCRAKGSHPKSTFESSQGQELEEEEMSSVDIDELDDFNKLTALQTQDEGELVI
jgi:hypothetical protein